MFKSFTAALAVNSLLLAAAGKVYLEESFPVGESYQNRWVFPSANYMEPSSKRFYFDKGDLHDDDSFYGLIARDPDSRYAISTKLAKELNPAESTIISVEFKVQHE